MKTLIAYSDDLNPKKYQALREQARRLGVIRTEIWDRFGSVNSLNLSDRSIRDQWLKANKKFDVLANPWKETLRDAIGDIKASRESAKDSVIQAIRRRTQDKLEQKRLYTLLKHDKWRSDPYLSRMMRKHWRRGHNHTHNQIIVRSDNYSTFTLAGVD